MSNIIAIERFGQTHARIEKMFWLAGVDGNDDLNDILERIDAECLSECFPDVKFRDDNILQTLTDHSKFGFFVEIHISQCYGFHFEKGNKRPIACSVGRGISYVRNAYGETPAQLLKQIEKISEECYQMDIAKEKKKSSK